MEAMPPACSMMNAMGMHSYSMRSLPLGLAAKHEKILFSQKMDLELYIGGPKLYI